MEGGRQDRSRAYEQGTHEGQESAPDKTVRKHKAVVLTHNLIAASISEKYDFGDLRSDLQRKLPHICSGT